MTGLTLTVIALGILIMTLIYEYFCSKTNKKSRMSMIPTLIGMVLTAILFALEVLNIFHQTIWLLSSPHPWINILLACLGLGIGILIYTMYRQRSR